MPSMSPEDIERKERFCAVCDDTPAKVHYGVLACFGCKGFFRRAVKDGRNKYVCRYEKKCLVTKTGRNTCRYCRFRKCLQVGMNPDAVRPDRGDRRGSNTGCESKGGAAGLQPLRTRVKGGYSKKKSLGRTMSVMVQAEGEGDWTALLAPDHRAKLLEIIRLSKEVQSAEELSFESIAEFSLRSLIADRSLTRNFRSCAIPSTSYDSSFTAIWRVVSVVDWVDGLLKIMENEKPKSAITSEDKLSLVQGAFCPLTLLTMCVKGVASPSLNDINLVRSLIENAKMHYPIRDLMRRLAMEIVAPLRHCNMRETEYVLLSAIIALNPDCPGMCSAGASRLRDLRALLFDILMKTIKRTYPKSSTTPIAHFGQLLSLISPLKHLAGDISAYLSTQYPRTPKMPSGTGEQPFIQPYAEIMTDIFNPEVNDLVLARALCTASPSSSLPGSSCMLFPSCSVGSASSPIDTGLSPSSCCVLYDLSSPSSTTSSLLLTPMQPSFTSISSPAIQVALCGEFSPPCHRSAFQQPSPCPSFSSSSSTMFYSSPPLGSHQMMPPPPLPCSVSNPFSVPLSTGLSFSSKLPLKLTKSIEEILRPAGMAEDATFINRPLASDWAETSGMTTPVFNREVVAQFFPEIAGQMNT